MNNIPRSEHPFPQMRRSEWLNLNGVWEFAETDESEEAKYLGAEPYPDKIIVPFCRESVLSGLGRKGFVKNVWYRRTFRKPDAWRSPRVLLHIGACDWLTRVWLNGEYLGDHRGGSAPFAFDITDHLKPGDNTVIVHAFDDTRSGLQALGKQSSREESYGCHYTRTTGIWQTVWLEGVGSSFISDCRIQTDPENSRVILQPEIDGPSQGLKLKAVAYAGRKIVGTAEAPVSWRDNNIVLDLSDKHLWSVEDPFLYDLKLTLHKGSKIIDRLDSYFGLRSVSIRGAAILMNDKPVFQRLVLDQGFYPDGIWTAPNDEALRHDIAMSQAVGFNGARLHQKVFEPRFLYWADKMGYLVWGEFPNWGLNYADPRVNLPMIDEWVEVVRRDRNHPSIVGWCPFNETPREAVELQNSVVNVTRTLDPSRPIIDTSGWTHGLPDAEVLDAHDYDQNPETFRGRWKDNFDPNGSIPTRYCGGSEAGVVPFMVSEYGGIGWNTEGGWGYGNAPKTLDEFYSRYKGLTDALLDNRYMFGFCYTQLTDVEQEKNGIYTYDRKPKFDLKRIRAVNVRIAEYEKDPPLVTLPPRDDWQVLVGAVPDGTLSRKWRYTTKPQSDGWFSPGFDDSSWQKGRGGFGRKDGWKKFIKTPWDTKDIWLRQEFTCDSDRIENANLVIHYDNGTEVYINGKEIWKGTGWNDRYEGFDVTDPVREALRPGKNLIAIHCHQDEGGQFIDAALLVRPFGRGQGPEVGGQGHRH